MSDGPTPPDNPPDNSYLDSPPDVHNGEPPIAGKGYHVFQFDPPFNNDNPYTAEELQTVAEGLDVFLNETFDGNGRACGTCHIPSAQYNIMPKDIQTLPAAEKQLVLGGTNTELENTEAVEKFALFNITEEFSEDSAGQQENPHGPFRGSMPLLSNGLGLTTLNFHVCDDDEGGLSGNPFNFGHGLYTPCNRGNVGAGLGFFNRPATNPFNYLGSGLRKYHNHDFPDCTENAFDAWPSEMVCVTDVPFLHAKRFGALPSTNGAVDDGTRDVMLGWNGAGAIIEMFEYEGPEVPAAEDCEEAFEHFDDLENLDDVLALFALTAVKTHFPITQNRTPGEDFRCPTIEELEAIALHNKWLGRRYELDITELDFVTSLGNEGRDLFLDRNASCAGCHINAGANDNQGRLKLGPFDVLPPLTDDQVALATYECPEVVHCGVEIECAIDEDCPVGATCNDDDLCEDSGEVVLVPDDDECESPLDGRFDAEDYDTCEDDSASEHYLTCVNDSGMPYYFDDLVSSLDELMPRSGMGANKTSRSGTQFLESIVDDQVSFDFPFDPGDGQLRSGGTQGGFNVQPVHQAAVKTNFFHNHAVVGKLENAIAHYFTPNFDNSQGGNAINNSFRCRKGGPASLAALGGPEAIDKMGYFIRSLFSVYAIADCERFMDEAAFRMDEEIGDVNIPLEHCQFLLNDVQTAFKDSNINTNVNRAVLSKTNKINGQITSILAQLQNAENGSEKKKEKQMQRIEAAIENLRDDFQEVRENIATTPEIED